MPILRLLARLGLDKTGFDAGMAEANKQVGQFGAGLKSQLAGAFAVGAVIAFARETITAAEAVGDLSERLGVSIRDAQQFALAAKTGGADVEYFASKFEKLRAAMAAAKPGENPLGSFGITTQDPSVALKQLATLINNVGLTADQASRFVEIFGKGSGKLINVLGDFDKVKNAPFFSDADVRNAQAISDSWTIMANSAKVIAQRVYSATTVLGNLMFWNAQKKTPGGGVSASALAGAEESFAVREEKAKAHMAIQERILDMERETNEINEKTRRSKLTDAQRLLELKKEEGILRENLRTEKPDETGTFQEGYYMMQKRLAEVMSEEEGFRKKELSRHETIASDQFQRIGAFTGQSASQAQLDISRRQLRSIEEMNKALTSSGILVKGTD